VTSSPDDLVDTSIWIRFLTTLREPFATELDQLLAEDEVLAHDLAYGELFMAERGGRATLSTAYSEIIEHRRSRMTKSSRS